jgi:diguanylate cyclase (GGDEF)-like protein
VNKPQPTNHQLDTVLRDWRVQAQTRLMTASLILLLPALVHTISRAVHYPQEMVAAICLALLYLGIAWLNFRPQIDVRMRGWLLMLVMIVASVISMGRGGLAGDGRVYLILLPIFGSLLVNARAGQLLAFVSALTYFVFGVLAHYGILTRWLIIPDNPTTYEFWLYDGLVFLAFLGVSVFLLVDFSNFLIRTLAAERRAAEKLLETHQKLDQANLFLEEKVEQRTSELAEANRRLNQLVHHDPLTGLPNRTLFFRNLDHSIIQAQHHQCNLAVLFLDLDNFKTINDTFGHVQGDRFLEQVAKRLRSNVRESDTVARLSGDEFAIIIEELASEEDAGFVAQKLIEVLSESFEIGQSSVGLSASIGISIFPRDGADSDALIRHADAAMYQIKHTTKGNFTFYK